MADTERSLASILTLYADNITGNISPQDARDMIVSLTPKHGVLHRNVAAATTIGVAGTYYKAAGTSTLLDGNGFTMPADNRLMFSGAAQRHVFVSASISMTSASSNQVLGLKVYHYDDSAASGAVIDSSVARRKVGTGADLGAASIGTFVHMDTSDYIEIWVTNETGANNITLDEFNLTAVAFLA